MNTQKQVFLIVALFFLFIASCAAYSAIDLPVRAGRQEVFFQSESVERGALLFANNCRTCHGIQGQGGVGLPLNKPEFQDQDPLILKANKDLIRRTLSCGRAGTLMPAWLNTNGGSLNSRQIEHIIDLLTSPVDEKNKDEEGNATSKGWLQAVEFAHNLNRASAAIVGGDTLDGIAKSHQIGLKPLSALNGNVSPTELLAQGSKVTLPPSKQFPNGRTHDVLKDNETLAKIADTEHVGAAILADLNNILSDIDKKGNFNLLDGKTKTPVTGLFPGDILALLADSPYVVRSGDTIDSIAAHHGITATQLKSLNTALGSAANADPIDFERKLKLPSGAGVVVQAGQTLGVIATQHGLKLDDLAKLNNLAGDAVVAEGQQLSLPSGTLYTIQAGDTLQKISASHGGADIAGANGLKAGDAISPEVILQLPKIDKFVIQGQNLEQIATGYSNVTADSLGKANGVPANAVLRVGQSLKLPADAWGSAPPDSKNPGTACVQYAVPKSVIDTLPGVGTAVAIQQPTTESKDVTITSHSTDWQITADGKDQDINKGAVLVRKGTAVKFADKIGLHTISINAKKDGANFNTGDTRTITFNDAGTFKITCEFHPEMLAYVYVQ